MQNRLQPFLLKHFYFKMEQYIIESWTWETEEGEHSLRIYLSKDLLISRIPGPAPKSNRPTVGVVEDIANEGLFLKKTRRIL